MFFSAICNFVYNLENPSYMWLDRLVVDMSSYLEDPKLLLRKVRIGVEGSIGPVLLKAQDPYSNQ